MDKLYGDPVRIACDLADSQRAAIPIEGRVHDTMTSAPPLSSSSLFCCSSLSQKHEIHQRSRAFFHFGGSFLSRAVDFTRGGKFGGQGSGVGVLMVLTAVLTQIL